MLENFKTNWVEKHCMSYELLTEDVDTTPKSF